MEFSFDEVEPGRVTVLAQPSQRYYNMLKVVHGGFAATLLDSAAGCAVHTTLPAGVSCATVDLVVHFVRPALPSTGPVRAEGRVLHRGSRIALAEAHLRAREDDRLLAHASSVCLVLPETVRHNATRGLKGTSAACHSHRPGGTVWPRRRSNAEVRPMKKIISRA
jgi:uncharacterized protein (TIGR00369 family)